MALGVNIVTEFNAKGIERAIADFKKLKSGGDKAAFGLQTMDAAITNGVKNIAKYGAIIAGTAGTLAYSLVNAASATEESMSKVRVVFGGAADEVVAFAETASDSIGLSKQKALEAAGTYGNLFQAFGIGKTASQEMSVELVKLAADLASFNNTSMEAALQALRSGLSGETEPLKRYGVALNDARLKQEALNLGIYKGKGVLDVTTKSQAAFALIMKDTALAQGDFARTSDGLANQQRILAAQFADVRAELGEALMPVFKMLIGFITEQVLPKIREFADVLKEKGIGGALRFAADEFLNFTSSGGKAKDTLMILVTAFGALKAAVIAYKAAVAVATFITKVFNITLAANPIGLIAAAIAAVIVVLVAAYLRFEGFRKVVNFVINAIIGYFEFMTNVWIKGINFVIKGINLMGGVLRRFGINVPKIGELGEVAFGRIGGAAQAAARQVIDVNKQIRTTEERLAGFGQKVKAETGTGTDPDPDPTGGGAAKAVKTAKEKLREYIDALKGASDAERSMARAGKDVAAARADLTKATQRVTEAQAKFNQVTRGYGADSKEAVDAMRKVQDAARKLRDANLSQQDAVRSLAAAEKRLADLRNLRAAPDDIAGAERKLERSKYSTEEAVFAVAEAEKKLAETRLDPEASAVDIRRAEIALAQAKLSVTDSTIAQRDAESELHKMRTLAATPEELAEAERELERAKYAVEDATTAVKDATVEQTVAQAFYTEIVEGAKEGSEAYIAALKDLHDAQEAERDASEKVTDALWKQYEATEALRKAKEELAATEAEVGARIVARGQAQFAASMPAGLNAAGAVATTTAGSSGGATTVVNNITAGLGADAKEIAQVIVDSLRDYERSNGFIPVTAQYAIAV